MNNNLLSSFVVVILILSFPALLYGQGLSQKSGNPGHKTGQSSQGADHQSHGGSPYTRSGKDAGSFGKHNSFHNKYDKSRSGSPNRDHGNGSGFSDKEHGKGKDRKHRGHFKNFFPYYFPPYYLYYGYSYYPDDYLYEDAASPYGFGTTLGTVLERPSNIEVNRYEHESGGERDNNRDYNKEETATEWGAPYAEGVYGIYTENYCPTPSEGRIIYIWVDENGVGNYVNDLDLVPLRYRDSIRIVGGE